jgi:Glycosyl hydrolase family 26
MFRNALRTAALIGFSAIAAACGETYQQAPTVLPSPTPVGLQTPAAGAIYLGAYVPAATGGVSSLETTIGRSLAMNMHYYAWANEFPRIAEQSDVENDRYPVESWDCGATDAQIASGAADPLIKTRALALRAFGHPVFLRFFWDMNLPASTVFPYSDASRSACYDASTDEANDVFSPKEFVAAWDHVRAIFAQEDATNVIFVWDVASSGSNPSAYYPGASEVDWVGVDTYETGSDNFSTLFTPTYTFLATYGKPIMIGETGAILSNQPNFLNGIPAALQSSFPSVRAFLYFDGENGAYNYTLSAPLGTAAFTTLAGNSYMSAFGTP